VGIAQGLRIGFGGDFKKIKKALSPRGNNSQTPKKPKLERIFQRMWKKGGILGFLGKKGNTPPPRACVGNFGEGPEFFGENFLRTSVFSFAPPGRNFFGGGEKKHTCAVGGRYLKTPQKTA